MTKAKCLLLAVAAAAMAFTVSCSSDGGSENIGTCGGREYDTRLGYSCVNGELVGSCRGKDYYPEYEHCENGEVKEGTAISSSSGGGGSSPSGGGSNLSDLPKQVYFVETDYDNNDNLIIRQKDRYTGNTNISMLFNEYGYEKYDTIPMGRIQNGQLQLDLPASVNSKYLRKWEPNDSNDCEHDCQSQSTLSVVPNDLACFTKDDFRVTIPGKSRCGLYPILIKSGKPIGEANFSYCSESGRITGTVTAYDGYQIRYDINLSKGWNILYEDEESDSYENLTTSLPAGAALEWWLECSEGDSDNGGGGGGNTQEKTLAITMPPDIFSNTADFEVYIVPAGTTLETLYQSAEDIIIAVGGNMLNLDWSYSGTTASFPLYKFKFDGGGITDGRWTGSGTYNVFVVFENDIGSYIYLKESVNFSSATTNIQINSGNLVSSTEGGVPTPAKTQFTDSRNSKTYNKVTIGTQVWMAENLNYNASGSKCYDDDPANCNTYGRLYDWVTAMALDQSCYEDTCSDQVQAKHRGICPSGWHLPSQAEWEVMTAYVGGASTEGKRLKATSGWSSNGNGTDDYGFSALPGGGGFSDGSFNSVGDYGYFDDVGDYGNWWSASELNSGSAYGRYMDYSIEYAGWYDISKSFLFSVRCLQD